MKFTYWSGNKKELEEALKQREDRLISLSESLGLDSSKVRVTYNYKDQTNKSKEAKKKALDDIDTSNNSKLSRATVSTYKNGTIAIRVNDSIVKNKIASKIDSIPQIKEEDTYEYAADIEADIVASYIALYGVQVSEAYKSIEELEGVEFEHLVAMFIASYLKLSIEPFYDAVRVVSDPYFYESINNLKENDWQDLFDICNYYRIKYGSSFREAMIKMNKISRLNSRLNSIIDILEEYLEEYIASQDASKK